MTLIVPEFNLLSDVVCKQTPEAFDVLSLYPNDKPLTLRFEDLVKGDLYVGGTDWQRLYPDETNSKFYYLGGPHSNAADLVAKVRSVIERLEEFGMREKNVSYSKKVLRAYHAAELKGIEARDK